MSPADLYIESQMSHIGAQTASGVSSVVVNRQVTETRDSGKRGAVRGSSAVSGKPRRQPEDSFREIGHAGERPVWRYY